MKKQSSASLKYDTPTLTTSANTKPKETNIRVNMMKPRKNKINIINKKK
jgi:hypothetical protein